MTLLTDRQTAGQKDRESVESVDKDSSFFETKNGFVKKYEI